MDALGWGLVAPRLQYFQAVVQHGSIRRASQELAVAPSAISRSIRQLEADMGVALFERIRQRLRLTSAGEALAHHARASQRELTRACAFIGDLQGLRRGHVGIVAVESVSRSLLPTVLSTFWQRLPNVTVDIRIAGSQEAIEALADGECDLAIAFDVRVPRKSRRLATAHLGLGALVAPSHPAAAHVGGLRLRDFAAYPVLLADNSLTLGRLLEDATAQAGIALRTRAVSTSLHSLLALAAGGHGVTFQTRVGVEEETTSGRLVFIPLLDRDIGTRHLSLLAPAQGTLSEAPASLAVLLSAALAEVDERTPASGPAV